MGCFGGGGGGGARTLRWERCGRLVMTGSVRRGVSEVTTVAESSEPTGMPDCRRLSRQR